MAGWTSRSVGGRQAHRDLRRRRRAGCGRRGGPVRRPGDRRRLRAHGPVVEQRPVGWSRRGSSRTVALTLGYGVLGKFDPPAPRLPRHTHRGRAGRRGQPGRRRPHLHVGHRVGHVRSAVAARTARRTRAFGTNGLVIADFGTGNETTGGLIVQPDGRLVLAGSAQQSLHSTRPALLRLLPDGRPDPEFGNAGRVAVDLGLGARDPGRGRTLRCFRTAGWPSPAGQPTSSVTTAGPSGGPHHRRHSRRPFRRHRLLPDSPRPSRSAAHSP